jgi:outer membrane protein assembly factor BamB
MRRRVLLLSCLILPACGGYRPHVSPEVFPAATSWRLDLERPTEGRLATDGRRVFAHLEGGEIRALDLNTGAQLWSRRHRPGRLSAGFGQLLLKREDGRLISLDPETGKERFQADSGVHGALPAVPTGSEVLVAGLGAAALDPRDGSLIWSAFEDGGTAVQAPVAAGACVLIVEEDGSLRCRNRATGATSWTVFLGEGAHAPPTADERERLYLGTRARAIVALRADKGGKRDWRWRTGAAAPEPAALYGDRLLVATLGNVLYCLNRGNGNMIWRAPLPSRPFGGPLLYGAAVLMACHESVVEAFDVETGERLGSLHTPSPFLSAPLVTGDRLVVSLRDPWAILAMQLASDAPPEAPPDDPRAGGSRRGGPRPDGS